MSTNKTQDCFPHPKPATRQHVLAASGNQCAYPGCSDIIFDLEHETLVGDIAHIRGRCPSSPRHDENQSPESNRSYPNLMAMCKKHHAIIDGPKAASYSVSVLQTYKGNHETKVANDGDRRCIVPPNSQHTWNINGEPHIISWWVDRTGRPRLYSQEQLAVCNVLLEINLSLGKVCSLIETLPTVGNDVRVGDLIQQDWAKLNTSAPSVYGHFAQLMAMAPDITFSEFIGFVTSSHDPTALSEIGSERLRKVIEGMDSDVNSHFKSNVVQERT